MRDISYYNTNNFDDILQLEKPNAVLFLSTQTFAHRAMIRFCKKRSIPTIHLTHGVFATMATNSGKYYSYNLLSYSKFIISRALKMFRLTWPVYLRSLINTQANLKDYVLFFRDNLNLLLGRIASAADDSITDVCLIYLDSDKEFIEKHFNFKPDQIIVVGNPDLMYFGLKNDLINSYQMKSLSENSEVVYIDTSLILRGAIFTSIQEYVNHLTQLQFELKRIGKKLVVKLHPNFDSTEIPKTLQDQGVFVCEHNKFIDHLNSASFVITEASSAALIPAYMGLPILYAKFGMLSAHEFGKIFEGYPRGYYLKDISQLNEIFSALLTGGLEQKLEITNKWIDQNIGPKPIEDMPKRVVKEIMSVIKYPLHNPQNVQ